MLKLVTVIFFVLSLFMNTMCSKLREEANNCAGKREVECNKTPNCSYIWNSRQKQYTCKRS